MLVVGIVVVLFILGMFLNTLAVSPAADTEWQSDTDEEISTTPAGSGDETTPLAA